MGAPDEARRRQLRDDYRNAEQAARESLMPLGRPQLAALVEWVHRHVLDQGCDHTLRFTTAWSPGTTVDRERLLDGLAEVGGFWNCEVVMNCDPEDVFAGRGHSPTRNG